MTGVRAAILLAFVACRGEDVVVVGGKDFLEQDVLAEVVAQELESRGVEVERQLHLGGTHLAHEALKSGEIDLYVEYTGTALVEILDHAPLREAQRAREVVAGEYLRRWDLVVGPPLGFENTFAFVVRPGDADSLGLATIGDLAPHAPRWTIGVGPEFLDRADGYRGVTEIYGLEFGGVRQMDLGLLYRALVGGRIDVAVGNSTDGQIAALGLVVLRDDRRFFPPYEAVPIARREVLERHPSVGQALESLAGALPAEAMRSLNRSVTEGGDAGEVVRRWRGVREPAGAGVRTGSSNRREGG
jgi:glycine betaine/choline ABC-type transport system substrate-binding protein